MQQEAGNILVPEPTPGSSKDAQNNQKPGETDDSSPRSSLKTEVDQAWQNTRSILSNVNLALELEDSLNLTDVDAEKVLRIIQPELNEIRQHVMKLKLAGEKTLELVKRMIYEVRDKLTRIKDNRDKIHLEILAARELSWTKDYQPFTHALNQCSQLLGELNKQMRKQRTQSSSSEEELKPSGSKRPRVSKKHVTEQEHPANASTYTVTLSPRKNYDRDLLTLFYEVLHDTPMKVLWTKRVGKAIVIYLRQRDDMIKALKELNRYRIDKKKKLTSIIDVEVKASSRFAFKSSLMTSTVKNHLPFVKEGLIVEEAARNTLRIRNPEWFKHEHEIVALESYPVKNDPELGQMFILKLYVTASAHKRILSDIKKGTRLSAETTHLYLYDATEKLTCHKCHDEGHKLANCPVEEGHCKYCVEVDSHLSGKCPVRKNKAEWRCYRCRDHNLRQERQRAKRDENHAATDPNCPTALEAKRAQRLSNRLNKTI